ncbi:MAG: serine/threonine protein kinase [Deltaproteobacteria bacterium]|nr:serine/threonine protein kinase [Deltaproteobacteria bacterium]
MPEPETAGQGKAGSCPGGAPFGAWVLLRRLGSGGMSEVFLARPADPARAAERVAVKRLLPELAQIPDFIELFRRETRIASRLAHPNVVRLRDSGVVDGRCYIATEYVAGLDCWKVTRRLSRQGRKLGLGPVVRVVTEMLAGLEHIHNLRDDAGGILGIVHRDISPSNILISREGEVKLGDFGLALLPSEEAETRRRRRLRGKIRFLSPEQIAGAPLDARSDLFAVGVLMAELLLGRSPLQGDTDLAVLSSIRDVRLHLTDDFEKHVPAKLRRILLRSLAREPSERPPDAGAMRQELLDFSYRTGLHVGPRELAETVEALLRPGDVGDAEVLRYTLTPSEDQPVGPREPAVSESTRSVPTLQYRIRKRDGREFGPMPYARAVDGVLTAEFTAMDQAAINDGSFLPLTAVPGLRQHLPLLGQTTVSVVLPLQPDRKGRVEEDTVAAVFLTLAADRETGMLAFEEQRLRKEVYLVEGHPLYVSSNVRSEQLGDFLLSTGAIRPTELEMALAVAPRYGGKLADALVAIEVLDPVTLFELFCAHLRQRLLDLYLWTAGEWTFYRGVPCDQELCLAPAAEDLLRQGIAHTLAEGEEEEWWSTTAPLDVFPAPRPRPPRDWWTLRDAEAAIADTVDGGMSGVEALARVQGRLPDADRKTLLRAFHFCLTAGLIATAWG